MGPKLSKLPKWSGLVATAPGARDSPVATTMVQTPIPAHFSAARTAQHLCSDVGAYSNSRA
eukprot:454761-Rhodomonas_salina.1